VGRRRKCNKNSPEGRWKLVVYVAGETPITQSALENLRRICREHLDQRFRIKVVDLLERPEVAREEGIVVVPTLVRESPLPEKRIFGNLAAADLVTRALELPNLSLVKQQRRPE
jgi:circadian clock protein KaiB